MLSNHMFDSTATTSLLGMQHWETQITRRSVSPCKQECIPVWYVPSAAVAISVSAWGDVCLGGGCLPGGTGVCPGCLPRVSGQTDAFETITFPQLLLRMVIILVMNIQQFCSLNRTKWPTLTFCTYLQYM